MIRAAVTTIKGCLWAALFSLAAPGLAQNGDLPRADIVACVKAVNGLYITLRGKMQSHCLVLSGNFCEAPVSGPILACLRDMTADIEAYVSDVRPRLPASIMGNALHQKAYARTLERLDDPSTGARRCDANHSREFDRQICLATAAFGRLTNAADAARRAGIDLP